MLDILQRVDKKVSRIERLLQQGDNHSSVLKRLAKLEKALFSGSGAGLFISSASIARYLQSSNFVAGSSGWRINKVGTAEFENVIVRGELKATAVPPNEALMIGGSNLVTKSAGVLLNNVTTVASPTTFNVDVKDPASGHTQIFDAGDILLLKVSGTTNWLTISSVSDQTTFYRYVCTLSNGSATTWYAGTAITDYGPSGGGGILLTADAANSPYIQIFTHAGSPWSTITEHVRIGNLNGWGPFSGDSYGIGFGDYSGGNYFYYDPSTTTSELSAGGGAVVIDENGIEIKDGIGYANKVKWSTTIGTGGDVGELYGDDTLGHTMYLYATGNGTTKDGRIYALADGGDFNDRSGLQVIAYTDGEAQLSLRAGPYFSSNFQEWDFTLSTVTATPFVRLRHLGTQKLYIYPSAGQYYFDWDGYLTLAAGSDVNEFSIDGTLAGNSDAAVPTEKAVKAYADLHLLATGTRTGATSQAQVFTNGIDINGMADGLILDADANSTISAPTDDQVDIEVGGSDIFRVVPTALKSQGSTFPDIGTTTLAEKIGNIYLGTAKDLYPSDDDYGVWTRLIDYGQTPDEHWRGGADDLTWTGWAAYTGYATPNSIFRVGSQLRVGHTGASRFFYYRAYTNDDARIYALVVAALACEGGVMLDDGVDTGDGEGANNFIRVFYEWPTATANGNLASEYRTGGGAVTKATYLSLSPTEMYALQLRYGVGTRWTNWLSRVHIGTRNVYATGASFPQIANIVSGLTWTPARQGIYGRVTAAGLNIIWDWYRELLS